MIYFKSIFITYIFLFHSHFAQSSNAINFFNEMTYDSKQSVCSFLNIKDIKNLFLVDRKNFVLSCEYIHKFLNIEYENLSFNQCKIFLNDIKKIISVIFHMKGEGLGRGKFGYQRNPALCNQVIQMGIKKRYAWALEEMVDQFNFGFGAYFGKDQAKLMIDEGISLNENWAYDKKIEGLKKGMYGFSYDNDEALKLIELQKTLTTLGSLKITEDLDSAYDNLPNTSETHQYIEKEIKKGKAWAFKKKIEGLQDGTFGFTQAPLEVKDFIENELMKYKIFIHCNFTSDSK